MYGIVKNVKKYNLLDLIIVLFVKSVLQIMIIIVLGLENVSEVKIYFIFGHFLSQQLFSSLILLQSC